MKKQNKIHTKVQKHQTHVSKIRIPFNTKIVGNWIIVAGLLLSILLSAILWSIPMMLTIGFQAKTSLELGIGLLIFSLNWLIVASLMIYQLLHFSIKQKGLAWMMVTALIVTGLHISFFRQSYGFIFLALALLGALIFLAGSLAWLKNMCHPATSTTSAKWLTFLGILILWSSLDIGNAIQNLSADSQTPILITICWLLTSPIMWTSLLALTYFTLDLTITIRRSTAIAQILLSSLALISIVYILTQQYYFSPLPDILKGLGSLAVLVGAAIQLSPQEEKQPDQQPPQAEHILSALIGESRKWVIAGAVLIFISIAGYLTGLALDNANGYFLFLLLLGIYIVVKGVTQ